MRALASTCWSIALTLWVGGLWIIGYLVVPLLFSGFSDRQLAGQIAGKLFHAQAWVGFAAALVMAGALWVACCRQVWRRADWWLIWAMFGLNLLTLLYIQPMMGQMKAEVLPLDVMSSPMRDRFALWHGISSGLHLLQSLLGGWLVIRSSRQSLA